MVIGNNGKLNNKGIVEYRIIKEMELKSEVKNI